MFTLYIRTDNDAFRPDPRDEIGRILRAVAVKIECGDDCGSYLTIFDKNGNDVGRFALKEGEGQT